MSVPDFLEPGLRDRPSEWPEVDPELVDALRKHPIKLTITPQQYEARLRIAQQRWFLLGNWTRARSGPRGREGAVEANFTLGGIERPFNGLDAVFAFLAQRLGVDVSMRDVVDALFSELVQLGEVKPITPERAKQLRTEILLTTGVDIAAPERKRR